MSEFTLSYREVVPDQTTIDPVKEITLSPGGTQSTLQDIKVAERSNGYCYEDCSRYHTRNRFIYWRINYDVLDLVEHSLDINLSENRVRYKFIDTPILDGVSVHETSDHVVVLVPTVCSIHRLIFPHPDSFVQLGNLGNHPDLAAPSIFAHASATDARNPNMFHVFNNANISSDQLPTLACSYLTPDNEAIFALAYPSTELLLIKQSSQGQALSMELKNETLMPRFLSGIAEKLRSRNSDGENVVSLIIVMLEGEPFVLTLCTDGQLKFWSCIKGQCVAVINIFSETGDVPKDHVQRAILRKSVNGEEGTLVVFMSFSTNCQFHVFKPTMVNGQQIRIVRLNMLHSPENDLIDFTFQTNRLWSAWRCENGDCAVYTASLNSSNYWCPIVLETIPDANQPPNTEGDKDPRQVYLEYIFYPGRFPIHIISKALCIYKRSMVMADGNLSPSLLKQRICMAVENDIQTTLHETVVNDEDYLDCANRCWQEFYSCVVQYHVAGLKPLGLLLLPSVSGAVFLKKTSFSFLRPLDPLEHMTLCSEDMFKDQFVDFPILNEDFETTRDVMSLFEIIAYLDQQLSDYFKIEFEKELSVLQSPDVVMDKLLTKVQIDDDNQFTYQVSSMLDQCGDIYKAIHKILELLRHEHNVGTPDEEMNLSALHYFSSQLGVSFVAGCLRQQAHTRFSVCRNLLLICNILLKQKELDWNLLEAIRSVCIPELVALTEAGFVMVWLSGLPAVVNVLHDITVQRLQPIKLTPVFNLRTNSPSPVSLLELFTASSGGYEAHKIFARSKNANSDLPHWHISLLSYLNYLTYLIYPVGRNNTILAEWLLASGQHLWLQQYVRLLSHWCDYNKCTRNFLLATSYLTIGEHYKAQELFEAAAKGVLTDTFLQQRILKDYEESPTTAYVNYYLKVIQLFELHKARDCTIHVANTALSIVDENDPLSATLYSIKFKHHLALKHYGKAFDSLNANPDAERKKDNLRDLVKTLLDEKQLSILLNFTYGSMDEFFANILLSRARATDAVDNIFYDFLYAYQIKRGPLCHRLAASIMYEQAFRLSNLNTVVALEKQLKCYLAAKNALQLCDPKHAWVVRPSDPDEENVQIAVEPLAGSNDDIRIITLSKQVEVLNINTIKEELIFSSAKLKLMKFTGSTSVNVIDPTELVTLLNNAGLFKSALQICTTFKLPYNSVFENLTKHCILLMENEVANAWDWLVENDLQDLPVNRDNVADIVWQLLQNYLEKFEEDNMTVLHYVVCKKIIMMRMFIPCWLLASYKKRNAAELLKLLHSSGRLQDALKLVHEYLLAAMGYGKEFFGFVTALTPNAPAFCLPVYAIQNLIKELELQNLRNVEQPYVNEHANLKELFRKYLETSTRISKDMCRYKLQLVK